MAKPLIQLPKVSWNFVKLSAAMSKYAWRICGARASSEFAGRFSAPDCVKHMHNVAFLATNHSMLRIAIQQIESWGGAHRKKADVTLALRLASAHSWYFLRAVCPLTEFSETYVSRHQLRPY